MNVALANADKVQHYRHAQHDPLALVKVSIQFWCPEREKVECSIQVYMFHT